MCKQSHILREVLNTIAEYTDDFDLLPNGRVTVFAYKSDDEVIEITIDVHGKIIISRDKGRGFHYKTLYLKDDATVNDLDELCRKVFG